MNALVLGPTGMVGDAIVREALQDTRIESLAAVARRPLRQTHPRLRLIIREDFSNFRPLEPALAGTDVVITDSQEVARAVLHAATGGRGSSPADTRDIIAAANAYAKTAPAEPVER